jgi:hypothetical protein
VEIFILLGIIGGVALGAGTIIKLSLDKNKDKSPKKDDAAKKEEKQTEQATQSEQTVSSNKFSSVSAESSNKILTSNPKTKSNNATVQLSKAAEIKNKVLNEESAEEEILAIDREDLKKILTFILPINAAISTLDKLTVEEKFDELVKNQDYSAIIVEHIENMNDDYSKLHSEANELKKQISNLIKTNKQLLLDTKMAFDDTTFADYEKNIMQDAEKLDDEYTNSLYSINKLLDYSANCINFCTALAKVCKKIPVDKTDLNYRRAFGKKGAYFLLKNEHKELLSLYSSSILSLKRVESLLAKIKNTTNNALAA